MTTAAVVDAVSLELLVAAAELRLIGLVFERPQPGWREHVRSLAREAREPRLRAFLDAELPDEGTHLALVGPGGLVPAREAAHVGLPMPGPLLAELRGVYAAFGFSPLTEEAPDHVSVEVAFLSFLKVKEAAARFDGHEALAREAARTAAAFARAHVARLAGPLADRLPGAGLPGMDVLQGAAESLRERVGLPETAAAPPPEEDPCDACPAAGGDFTGA